MTVGELIEALQGFDSDLDVYCPAWDDEITDFNPRYIELRDAVYL